MRQFSSEIIQNRKISRDFFELSFTWARPAGEPLPGQFLTIRVSDSSTPLLRRPFAISNITGEDASIIYQKRGVSTEILSGKQPGDTIDVIAPLGKPFSLPPKGDRALLVAGGIGLGPILFLSSVLRKRGYESKFIFGCRTKTLIPECESFDLEKPQICTDDGSAGFNGNVREYLESIKKKIASGTIIYCCGPGPMLRSCGEFASNEGLRCQVSVEQIMACGVGACMGCAVKVKGGSGYLRACKDGPVFNSTEIEL